MCKQELVLVSPAVLPKLHTIAQAMLRCRGSQVFKVHLLHTMPIGTALKQCAMQTCKGGRRQEADLQR